MRKYSPRTAKTFDQLCSLRRDNASYGGYWILAEADDVTIAKQTLGEAAESVITIDKKTFNQMIAFYQRPTRAKP